MKPVKKKSTLSMRPAKILKEQHKELLALVEACSSIFSLDSDRVDYSELNKALLQFHGKLRVHLSMEDDFLYPKLLRHDDQKISGTAKRFKEEFGGIGEALKLYKEKWPTQSKIQEGYQSFKAETQEIFKVLKKRIQEEETGLYPLL